MQETPRKNTYLRRISLSLLICIVCVALLTPSFVYAAPEEATVGWMLMPQMMIVRAMLYIAVTVTGFFISWAATALDAVISWDVVASLEVLKPTWVVVRDFSNMFFIVFLIIMAFATIFDLGGSLAGYDVGSLIGKFLIAALLINFSMVIGTQIVYVTNSVNSTFLTSIGSIGDQLLKNVKPWELAGVKAGADTSAPSLIGSLYVCATSPSSCFADDGGGLTDFAVKNYDSLVSIVDAPNATFIEIVALFFNLIFSLILFFSLLTPLLFAVIRIPMLWFYLVLSPLAWLCNVLPATRHFSKQWWSGFMGWTLFLPIYLFFLSMAVGILNKQTAIMHALTAKFPLDGILNTGTSAIQMIFFYVFVGIAFIGGTIVAKSAAAAAGSGGVAAAKWASGAVSRVTGVTATGQAFKNRWQQTKEEGLGGRLGALYGGQRGLETQTAKIGSIFGVRGADIAAQKPFVDTVGKEYSALQDQYRTGRVKAEQIRQVAMSGSAGDPKVLSYRKMAAEMGMLTPEMLTKTATELNRNPLALNSFFESAKKGKFQELSPEQQLAAASASEYTDTKTGRVYDFTSLGSQAASDGRREIFSSISDNKKAVQKLTTEQYISAIDLYGGAATVGARDFMKKVNAQRPDLASDSRIQEKLPESMRKSKLEVYKSLLADAKPETIAETTIDVWDDPEFQDVLRTRFKNRDDKGRAELYSKLLEEIDGSGTTKAEDKITKRAVVDEIHDSVSAEGSDWEKKFASQREREERMKSRNI